MPIEWGGPTLSGLGVLGCVMFKSAAAGVLLFVAAAGSAEPVLQPTGKWTVDLGDSHCVATRNYGTDSDPLYLVLKQRPLGKVLQLGIVPKPSRWMATSFLMRVRRFQLP